MAGKRKGTGSSSKKRNGDGDKRPFITPRDLELDPDSSDDDVRNDDEATILVKAPTGKTITLKVKGSDTIGSIKVKIQAKEPIPFDQQELIFNRIALENRDTVANLRIKKKATLTLLRKSTGFITVYVKTLGDDVTHSFNLKPYDTISSIKSKNFGYYEGELIFNDVVLDDSGTLADFNIVDRSTLTHVFKEARKMKVFVNTYTGKTITVFVDPTYTVSDLKFYIADVEGIPRDEQVLIYNNMVLGDGGTLSDFNITRKSTLTLMHRPREFEKFMRIHIKTLTGETVTLEVKPDDTIGDIKPKIQEMVGAPCDEQELIFNEMVIHDVHTLSDFHINNESTLTLMRISNGFMRVFIKSDTGETIALDARPSDTIHDVKTKFCNKNHVSSPSMLVLIFNGKQLEDSATLADYHVSDESTICFEYKPINTF